MCTVHAPGYRYPAGFRSTLPRGSRWPLPPNSHLTPRLLPRGRASRTPGPPRPCNGHVRCRRDPMATLTSYPPDAPDDMDPEGTCERAPILKVVFPSITARHPLSACSDEVNSRDQYLPLNLRSDSIQHFHLLHHSSTKAISMGFVCMKLDQLLHNFRVHLGESAFEGSGPFR